MLRARVIKPGIAYNEDLGRLGPVAEVIFTRLWMLADREGRLEWRPEKIKLEALANYPDITVEVLIKTVENLCKTGMTELYSDAAKRASSRKFYVSVVNFAKYQWVHANEAKSILPAPPSSNRKQAGNSATSPGNVRETPKAPRRSQKRTALSYNLLASNSNDGDTRVREGSEFPTEEPPPSGPNPGTPKRKTPTPAQSNGSRSEAPPRQKAGAVDMFPHSPDDVAVVRASLCEMAGLLHMPNPDDGIVRQVLDAGNGATGAAIHGVLRELWFSKKFRNMHSWGLLPVVVAPWFRKRLAG